MGNKSSSVKDWSNDLVPRNVSLGLAKPQGAYCHSHHETSFMLGFSVAFLEYIEYSFDRIFAQGYLQPDPRLSNLSLILAHAPTQLWLFKQGLTHSMVAGDIFVISPA